jgi:hypothetical protein
LPRTDSLTGTWMRSSTLAEIEIELKHGDPREAARLAKKLARIHRGHVALIKGELHIARLPSAMP